MDKNKKIKTDISVVLPIHELNNEKEVALFKTAIESVVNQESKPEELLIVVPIGSKVEETMKTFDFGGAKDIVKVVVNPDGAGFQAQINYGVSQVKSKWFSFLEFDDEYSNKWFKNVVEYREAHTDVEIFMPIIVDTDSNSGTFMGLTNEAVWANSFSDELGILDENGLLTFQNFNIDGIVMQKEAFENWGGFKKNIKLTFIYEFLLRMVTNGVKTMVIPRFGYKHQNKREGSLFEQYSNEMDPLEAKWWLEQAKKEYFHKRERDISYDKSII
jgi:glycosyltransferase involved in cell wall biosynthesis